MSPVSRGRKGKNKNKTAKSARQPAALDLFSAPDTCECPACSGEDVDPRRLIDGVLTGAADLVGSADPLEAEIAGSVFVSIGALAGEEFTEALVDAFIPEFEARACPEAVAMLLAIGSVAPDPVGKGAAAAADRLVAAGPPRPGWAGELGQPITTDECWRLSDPAGTGAMLACSFHRAGRSHAVVVSVDDLDCGAATDILLLEADQLPQALEMMRSQARAAYSCRWAALHHPCVVRSALGVGLSGLALEFEATNGSSPSTHASCPGSIRYASPGPRSSSLPSVDAMCSRPETTYPRCAA